MNPFFFVLQTFHILSDTWKSCVEGATPEAAGLILWIRNRGTAMWFLNDLDNDSLKCLDNLIEKPKIGDLLVFRILKCYGFLGFSLFCHWLCKIFCMDEKFPKLLWKTYFSLFNCAPTLLLSFGLSNLDGGLMTS